MKISTVFNNFSHGNADSDLNGRSDLPIYSTSAEVFRNFYSNFKGNAIFMPGFEMMLKFQDCAFIPFKFTASQSYLCVFYNTKIKFLSYDISGNFGFVQSGGGDLEVTSPYSLAESKQLKFDQNADVMYIVHPNHEPRKLTRVSATSFTLSTFTRTDDPFDNPSTGTVGYPSCVRFYKGRLWYANTTLKPTNVYGSKSAEYDVFTLGTGADDDSVQFQAADIAEPIEWLMDGYNSLIAGSNEGTLAINGGGVGTAITPSTVEATVTSADGSTSTQPLKKEDFLVYIRQDGRAMNYFRYDVLTENFKATNLNFLAYDITLGGISQLAYVKDKDDLVYTIRNDNVLLSLNFNAEERIIAWHEHKREVDFHQIAPLSNNEGLVSLFALVKKGSDYYICRKAKPIDFDKQINFYTGDKTADTNAYNRYVAEKLKECNYLDISSFVSNLYSTTITYTGDTAVDSEGTITSTGTEFTSDDVGNWIVYKTETGLEVGYFEITGYTSSSEVSVKVLYEPTATSYSSWYRTFNKITGFTDFIGEELSVVGDGGYLGDYTVNSSGEIELDREVTVACVGYKYEGLIKTFNLGAYVNGVSLQASQKRFYRGGVRFVNSAGGSIGSTLYDMVDIQKFNPSGLMDAPPLPMNSTEYVNYADDYEKEKYIYVKQSEPLPMNITGIFADVQYSTKN